MIGIGIIGAGFFGRRHADVVRKLPNVKFIAASRTNEKKLRIFCDEYSVQAYPDYRDLLKREDIDAVVIAVPHHKHKAIAIEAAKAGKHILLEKPMAHTVNDCVLIDNAARKSGVKLMIGHNMRYFRSSEIGKDILDSEELGEPVLGRSTISKYWMEENRRPWHLDADTGGGMLMTVGIHFIDVLSWLLNSKVKSVRAHISTRFHDQSADDMGLLFLQYENGLSGMVTSIGYSSGVTDFTTEITCTKGMLKINHLGGVYIGQKEAWSLVPDSIAEHPEEEALQNEWKAFVRSITMEKRPPVSGDYGLHIVGIIEAARQSSKMKQEIMLKDLVIPDMMINSE